MTLSICLDPSKNQKPAIVLLCACRRLSFLFQVAHRLDCLENDYLCKICEN